MADKDPLQNSINNLDKTMNALNKTVSGLTKAFNDMNRTEKTRNITQQKANDVTDKLVQVLQDVKSGKAIKKDGTLSSRYKNAIDKIVTQNRDFLKKYETIRTAGYNKDNPKDKLADVYRILEVQKHLSKQIAELGNKQQWSKQDISDIKKELFGADPGVSVDSSYKFVQNLQTGAQELIRTAGVFAQVRSEVVAFNQALKASAKAMQSSVASAGGVGKKVNDKIVQLASNSVMLNQLTKDLNKSVTRANSAIDRFTNRVNTASRNISSSTTSFRNVAKNLSTTNNTINKVNNNLTNLTKQTTNQTTSNISSFRQQQVRNSDRAKQAGFIALLIPALAKLLKKTPITDIFRYMALRWGSRLVQQGQKPVLPALAYMGAGVVGGALPIIFRKQIGKFVSSVFGSTKDLAIEGPKIGGKRVAWNQLSSYREGTLLAKQTQNMSTNQRNITLQRQGVVTLKRDPADARKFYRNKVGESVVDHWNAGQSAKYQGYWDARKQMRDAARLTPNTKTPYRLAKNMRWLGKVGTPLALAGFAIEDIAEGKFSRSIQQEGGKGFAKQTAKTAIGAGAGLAGLALGTKAGAAVGTMIGGPVGTVVGAGVGIAVGAVMAPLFKGLADGVTGNMKDQSKQWAETAKTNMGWQTSFGAKIIDIVAGLGEGLMTVIDLVKKILHLDDENNGGTINDDLESLERQRLTEELNKRKKQSEKEKKKLDEEQVTLNAIKAYKNGHSGFLWSKKKEYDKKIEAYKNDYALSLYGADKVMMTESNRKKKLKEAKNSQAAQDYANKKMNNYLKTEQHRLDVAKARYKNAVAIDPNQLVTRSFLTSNNQTTVANELAKRPGAYEKLKSKPGYWSAGGTFNHDVKYLGRGTQNTMKSLVDQGYIIPGFTVTSAIGARGNQDGKLGHQQAGQHYDPKGTAFDIVYKNTQMQKISAEGGWYNGKYYKGAKAAKQAGLLNGYADERPGTPAYKYASGGPNLHLSASNALSAVNAKEASKQVQTENSTATVEAQEADMKASSELRDDLAKFIKYKDKNGKQERARNIIMSAVDVTGSLGVWGITQINNNGMRVGK